MFVLLSVLATIFYALNAVLLAPIARRTNPHEISSIRGLSLGVSMSPLLFLIPDSNPFQIINNLSSEIVLVLSVACIGAAIGNVCLYSAQRYLPVGITLALCLSFAAIFSMFSGIFFLGNEISKLEIALVSLILFESFLLGASSSNSNFKEINIKKGVSFCFGFGLSLGIAYTAIGRASQEFSPILVGYIWEFGTGLIAFLILLLIYKPKKTFQSFNLNKIKTISIASSPTIVATSCYAFATTLGPLGILGAILATMGAVGALLSYFILGEKITRKEFLIILIMMITLALLKYVHS